MFQKLNQYFAWRGSGFGRNSELRRDMEDEVYDWIVSPFLLHDNNVASNPGLRSNVGFDVTSGFCILRASVFSVVNVSCVRLWWGGKKKDVCHFVCGGRFHEQCFLMGKEDWILKKEEQR